MVRIAALMKKGLRLAFAAGVAAGGVWGPNCCPDEEGIKTIPWPGKQR